MMRPMNDVQSFSHTEDGDYGSSVSWTVADRGTHTLTRVSLSADSDSTGESSNGSRGNSTTAPPGEMWGTQS